MTLALARAKPLMGRARPRVAPPIPARSRVAEFVATAAGLLIALMPWQRTAARYLTALGADGKWLYREICIVVARQNGKTKLLIPLIVERLLAGQRIMHTAQDRSLPREVFYAVADIMWKHHADLFPMRNGRPTKPRYANGQEEIRLTNGGIYSIVAPTRGGARGPSRDLVIIDELREMDTWDFIAAAKPTMTASANPQIVYLSNAGETDSVVLNAIRARAATDPELAYLEWSAAPGRTTDDPVGWTEANPAMGHEAEGMGPLVDTLSSEYVTKKLEGTLSIFEVEHLCRWMNTTRETLVDAAHWNQCQVDALEAAGRPSMAVSMDPSGTRSSAALAWPEADGSIALRLLFDVTGSPIDTDKLGQDLRATARSLRVASVGFDPLTDAMLAKFFPRSVPITGAQFANASSRFVATVEAHALHWHDADAVGDDLTWTARKPHDESGSFQAVRANDDRPIPATLAAIRAVWLASRPRPVPVPSRPSAMGF